MKEELSSPDIRALSLELRPRLKGGRVDKVYQVGKKEIVIRLHSGGKMEFVASPNFFAITRYKRPAPDMATSFSMQLRKHLRGKYIRDFRQHSFERIVEIVFDEHILIFELFSRGNVILVDRSLKIVGLLEWQRWKSRKLGVGQTYSYPPEVPNPYTLSRDDVKKVLSESDRPLAATLARRLSLGGYFAEKILEQAGLEKDKMFEEADFEPIYDGLLGLLAALEKKPTTLSDKDWISPVGGDSEASFNDAVDDFFSKMEAQEAADKMQSKTQDKREQLSKRLASQKQALERAKTLSVSEREKGDVIYQNMDRVGYVLDLVKKLKKEGLDDSQILEKLKETGYVDDFTGYELTLNL